MTDKIRPGTTGNGVAIMKRALIWKHALGYRYRQIAKAVPTRCAVTPNHMPTPLGRTGLHSSSDSIEVGVPSVRDEGVFGYFMKFLSCVFMTDYLALPGTWTGRLI